MNLFFSYPHDGNAAFVERLKRDLEARGHSVWFDAQAIKSGQGWRDRITRGILESDTVVAFLSKHSVRDPGVCLNEIAIALADKGDEAIVTVLVEPENEVNAPVSVTHIQWLKMDEHLTRSADAGWYRTHLDQLVDVIENPSLAHRHGELGLLRNALKPLSFNADIASHLPRFSGRQWLIARYENWLAMPPSGNANKVFRLEGGPGMGKTAVASYLAHATRGSVLGVHLCKSASASTHSPARLVLSLAYQMATRLPDYRARLLRVPCVNNPALMQDEDAGSLWDMLIAEPLAGAGKSGLMDRQRLAIVIDGLDEATHNGQNPIVELLVERMRTLPAWVGVVLTGRPDPELTQSLRHYTPQSIHCDDPANLDDLRHYIGAWLHEAVQAGRLPAHAVAAAAAALLQKSEGTFLYLAQAREEAEQSPQDGSNSFDLLQPATLPTGLDALYRRSFQRRFADVATNPDNPASRWNALAKPLLACLLASPEPLPLEVARSVMGWAADASGNEKQHMAFQSLGSLVKRSGDASHPAGCTLALFHNSVREWLASENAQGFRVFVDGAIYPLAAAAWSRYLEHQEEVAWPWQVLPQLLQQLPEAAQDTLLGEPRWDRSQALMRLAHSMEPALRYHAAVDCWLVQIRFSERLHRSDPENALFAHDLSISLDRLGNVLTSLGKTQRALGCYQRSMAIRAHLCALQPENPQFAHDLAVSFDHLGDNQVSQLEGQWAPAHYLRSLKMREDLCARFPDQLEYAVGLSNSLAKLGDAAFRSGKAREALDYYQRSLQMGEDRHAKAPENTAFAGDLSLGLAKLGDALTRLNRSPEALGYYQRSLHIREDLLAGSPDNAELAYALSTGCLQLGDAWASLERTDEALGCYQRSRKLLEDLLARAPESVRFAHPLSICLVQLGDTLLSRGQVDAALGYYMQSLKITQDLAASGLEDAGRLLEMSLPFHLVGEKLAELGKTSEALPFEEMSKTLLARIHAFA